MSVSNKLSYTKNALNDLGAKMEEINVVFNKDYPLNSWKDYLLTGGNADPIPNFAEHDLPNGTVGAYAMQLHSGDVILSTESVGTWLFDNELKETKQISSINSFTNFMLIDDDCFLSSNSGGVAGVYLYKGDTKTIKQIWMAGYDWTNLYAFGEYCFMSSGSSDSGGLLKYSRLTGGIVQCWAIGYNYSNFYPMENDLLISSANTTGVFLYELATDAVRQIYSSGAAWGNHIPFHQRVLMSRISSAGIIAYDTETKTILSTGYTQGYNYTYPFQISDTELLIGSSANQTTNGLVLYDYATNTATRLYDGGIYSLFDKLDNGCVARSTSSYPALLYNSTTKQVQILLPATAWSVIEAKDYYLYFYTSSGTHGLYYVNKETSELKQLSSTGYNWTSQEIAENVFLLSGTSGVGLRLFDGTSLKTLDNTTSRWTNFLPFGDDWLITGGGTGVWLYSTAEQTAALFFTTSTWATTLRLDNNWIMASTGSSSSYGGFLYADSANKTIIKFGTINAIYNLFLIDGEIYASRGTSSSYTGVYKIDLKSQTEELISNTGTNLSQHVFYNGKNYLVSSVDYNQVFNLTDLKSEALLSGIVDKGYILSSKTVGSLSSATTKVFEDAYPNYTYLDNYVLGIGDKKIMVGEFV